MGREMIRLGGPQEVTPFPGEDNELRYIPLGVGVVIPPWNFPLAITTGMTSADDRDREHLRAEAGQHGAGRGGEAGGDLRRSRLAAGCAELRARVRAARSATTSSSIRKTRFVAFTGSMEVGLGIYEKCGKVNKGQIWLKRAILEMGGKDCIVVDETADIDEAADGRRLLGVRLPGAEVLGVQPADRAPGHLRRAAREGRRRGRRS